MRKAGWIVVAVAVAFAVGLLVGSRVASAPAWPSYAALYDAVAPVSVDVSVDLPEKRFGSGFVVAPTEVVTARHVVLGAEEATVRTSDGRDVKARVVGTDARTDLALLVTEDGGLQPATLGSSLGLRVGDTVVLVGNPYGLGHSVSPGIVGGANRRLLLNGGAPGTSRTPPFADVGSTVGFLQITAPLHPGDSGGPVFDARGRVVAILTGIHAQGQAIGFAVPVEALVDVLPALASGEQMSRAYVGARTVATKDGLVVDEVIPAGPADRGGMHVGDRLVAVDGKPVPDRDALHTVLDGLVAGRTVVVAVERDHATVDLQIPLGDWAEHAVAVAGMTLQPFPGSGGIVVAIRPRSRAEQAGVQIGDIVRTVDGLPVQAPADVQDVVGADRNALLEVVRAGTSVPIPLPVSG